MLGRAAEPDASLTSAINAGLGYNQVDRSDGLAAPNMVNVHIAEQGTRIRSRMGEGTTVQIYLPRASGGSITRREDASTVVAQPSPRARILVVDDDPAVRWVTVECLREMGHLVAEADSGKSALTILDRGDPFDLVVMDMVMPGLSGPDTVRLARRTRSDLKVLFVTGYADTSASAGKDSTDLLIMKPFKPTVLAEAVRSAQGPGLSRAAQ